MTKRGSCSRCGNEKHYVRVKEKTNRFGVSGEIVHSVQCTSCGKSTKI